MRVDYETTGFSTGGGFDSFFSSQENATNTNRQNLWGDFTKVLSRRWGAYVFTDFLKSEEQKLDRRMVFGGGPSREIIRNNRFDLNAFGGAVWNNEQFSPGAETQPRRNSAEAFVGAEYSTWRFDRWEFENNAPMAGLFPN